MRFGLIAIILFTSLQATAQFKPRFALTVFDAQSLALETMFSDRIHDISLHPGMGGTVGITDSRFHFNVGYNYRNLRSAIFPSTESIRTNWHINFASFRQVSAQLLYGEKKSRMGIGLSKLYSHLEYNWSVYDGLDCILIPPTEPPTWDRSFNIYQVVFEHDFRLTDHWCITAHTSLGFKHEDRSQFSIHDRFIIPVRLNIARDL